MIDKKRFESALAELGHDPLLYKGKKIAIKDMSSLYKFDEESLLNAIENKVLRAHYDYQSDMIWVDALEAAYFYYCVSSFTESLLPITKSASRSQSV